MDGEVVLTVTDSGVTTSTALIQYFLPFDTPNIIEAGLYFVEGRLCSIDSSFPIGDNFNCDSYDFAIEAERMHSLNEPDIAPLQTYITVASTVCFIFLSSSSSDTIS